MKIKVIAMGVLATVLSTSAVFADDMQQNTQMGTPDGQAMTTQPAGQPMTGQQSTTVQTTTPTGAAVQTNTTVDGTGNPSMPASPTPVGVNPNGNNAMPNSNANPAPAAGNPAQQQGSY